MCSFRKEKPNIVSVEAMLLWTNSTYFVSAETAFIQTKIQLCAFQLSVCRNTCSLRQNHQVCDRRNNVFSDKFSNALTSEIVFSQYQLFGRRKRFLSENNSNCLTREIIFFLPADKKCQLCDRKTVLSQTKYQI